MTFQREEVWQGWFLNGVRWVSGKGCSLGVRAPSGFMPLTVDTIGTYWVRVGGGHVQILGGKVYPFRSRRDARCATSLASFLKDFTGFVRQREESLKRSRIEDLTLRGVLEEIDRRVKGLRASYDDIVWGESPSADRISSQVEALTDLGSWIKYRMGQNSG